MRKFLAGTAMCLCLAAHAASAQEFSSLVIFGDSLSDTGNIAKIVPAAVLASLPPGTSGVPAPPYYNFRFSNGPIYADTLGSKLGISSTQDFAVGGAYSGHLNETLGAVTVSGTNVSSLLSKLPIDTSMQGQITSYLGSGAQVSHNGLYVVWGGANDYFGVSAAVAAQPTLSTSQVQGIIAQGVTNTVGNLAGDVTVLAKAGAHNFLVPLLPNLGGTPSLNGSAATAQFGQLLTFTHNNALASTMGQLGQQLHVNIYLVDTATLFTDVQTNPSKYGVSNVTQACLTSAGVCSDPSSHVFWDSVHPTTGISQLFGAAVVATVNAPLVIGAQAQIADVATQQIFDSVSARVNALGQGAAGFTMSGPGGGASHMESNSPVSAYVSGSYGHGSRDDHPTETGFDYDHGSVQIGADVRVGNNGAVGIQAGFGSTSAHLNDGMGDDDLRTYSVAIYGGLFGEHWYGSVAGFYAYQDWDKLNRNTNVAGQVAAASTNGTDVGAKLEAGYMLHEGSLTYGPVAELRYARISINAYTEQGAVALNEAVDNQGFASIVSQIGGQVSTVCDFDGLMVKPTLHASWDHQYEGSRDVYSRLASLPQATIDTVLPKTGANWARVGLGVNVQANSRFSVVGDVDGNLARGDGQDVSGMVRLIYQF
jgi:outer membrane lipase/esterase